MADEPGRDSGDPSSDDAREAASEIVREEVAERLSEEIERGEVSEADAEEQLAPRGEPVLEEGHLPDDPEVPEADALEQSLDVEEDLDERGRD